MTRALCPICRKPIEPAFRPFCSKRCADVDLQRWFTGRYAIPVGGEGEESEFPPDAEEPIIEEQSYSDQPIIGATGSWICATS